MGSVIELGLRSWVSDVAGDHRIHEISLTGMVLVSTAGVIVQAYRPKLRVAALQAAILVPLIETAMSAITGGTVYEWATFLVLAGLMGLLHPAGRNLIRPFTADQFSPWLAGLVAVAAIPLLAFAVDQATIQVSVVDEHAAVEHYSEQAAYVLSILALGILAALKTRGSWFPALATGLLAIDQGLASVLFTATSSVGPIWGGAEIVWGVSFLILAAAESRGILDTVPNPGQELADVS